MTDETRAETTALGTVALMALVGQALYSGTYGVTYMVNGSFSANGRVVPTLELWMAYTHLLSSGCALVAQRLCVDLLGLTRAPEAIGQALCALFLAVALSVTCLSAACLSGAAPQQCALHYGAALLQSASATVAVVWAWVMYLAALGVGGPQQSAGVGGLSGFTVAAAMACVPTLTVGALLRECAGTRWDAELRGASAGTLTAGHAMLFVAVALPHLSRFGLPSSAGARAIAAAASTVLLAAHAAAILATPGLLSVSSYRAAMGVAAALPLVSTLRQLAFRRSDRDEAAAARAEVTSAGLLASAHHAQTKLRTL